MRFPLGLRKIVRWVTPCSGVSRRAITQDHSATGWNSLKLSPIVVDVVQRAIGPCPTRIQEEAIPCVMDKNQRVVVITAETGGGKTLSYLLPALQRCHTEGPSAPHTVVLVPGADLVHQVVLMARAIAHPKVEALYCAGADPSGSFTPSKLFGPHLNGKVIVATPRSAILAHRALGPDSWMSTAGCLVMDEADLLLGGSSAHDVQHLIHAAKQTAQLVFVAATLHDTGKKSAAAWIRHRFPHATFSSSQREHRALDAVKHTFRAVSEDSKDEVLRTLLPLHNDTNDAETRSSTNSLDSNAIGVVQSTLVFVNTAERAVEVASELAEEGYLAVALCRLVPAVERAARLTALRDGKVEVLVCTDMASRGLDTPQVGHVIQLDFARSAVDFLHRAGRTGRAGQAGQVTSLYSRGSTAEHLAMEMQAAVEEGRTMDGAFSRKRGFRKRRKKKAVW